MSELVIHLLWTDVVMPQMSGPELARRFAQDRPLTPATLTRKVREVLDAPAGVARDAISHLSPSHSAE